jgi:hypothetical protein
MEAMGCSNGPLSLQSDADTKRQLGPTFDDINRSNFWGSPPVALAICNAVERGSLMLRIVDAITAAA